MPPVEPLSYIGVMAVLILIIWRVYIRITDKHKADIDLINIECKSIQIKLTAIETKQDIYLHEIGFDVPDLNERIKSHMQELKLGTRPSVGCINMSTLKRRKARRPKDEQR